MENLIFQPELEIVHDALLSRGGNEKLQKNHKRAFLNFAPQHITSVLAAIGVIYCSEEKQKQLWESKFLLFIEKPSGT